MSKPEAKVKMIPLVEAAKRLGVSRANVQAMITDGRLYGEVETQRDPLRARWVVCENCLARAVGVRRQILRLWRELRASRCDAHQVEKPTPLTTKREAAWAPVKWK